MNLNSIPAGKNIPENIYAIIEIAANTNPVKYEIDKKTNVLFVDRFISNSMLYPCNYGYVNQTLSLDGDPIDVLIPTPYPLQPGCVILCRPIGMLCMIDESGEDSKLIAVPDVKISKIYNHIKNIKDMSKSLCTQIEYFFKHYKDLEYGKWTKIQGWNDIHAAKQEIMTSYERAQSKVKNDI